MNRRKFMRLGAMSGLAAMLAQAGGGRAEPPRNESATETMDAQHMQSMQSYAQLTDMPTATIGMLVYPSLFLQDLVGPLAVFEALMNREIHLLWKDTQPLKNDAHGRQPLIPVMPTTAFKDCPAHLDVLFVPGGVPGTFAMMEDEEVLGFLAEKGKTARFVTSVCTGSLILGAAGLLDGYKATSHWAVRDVLKELGAIPTPERVVVDRNRITGGGVTAGIDFGLTIAALLTSETYAQSIQLYLEYDPHPPFNAGSPEQAPRIVKQFMSDMLEGTKTSAVASARRARKKNISRGN